MTASRARLALLEVIELIEAKERAIEAKERAIEAKTRENMALSQELGKKVEDLRVQGNLVVRLQREVAQARAEVHRAAEECGPSAPA